MLRIPTHKEPIHPGKMLLEEFLQPMEITQKELSDAIRVPYQRINELVNGKRGITLSTALRLAKFFDMTTDYWINLQLTFDLYKAEKSEKAELNKIVDCEHFRKTA